MKAFIFFYKFVIRGDNVPEGTCTFLDTSHTVAPPTNIV